MCENEVEYAVAGCVPCVGELPGGVTSWENGKAIVGVHFIDFNRIHGGYTIRRIANAQGRESSPFGMQRHNAAEFVALLDGIIGAAHIIKSNAG